VRANTACGAPGQPEHPRAIGSKRLPHTSVSGESKEELCLRVFCLLFSSVKLCNKRFPPKFSVDIAGGLLLPVAAAMARFAVLYAA